MMEGVSVCLTCTVQESRAVDMAYSNAASRRGRNERQTIERSCERMVSESKGSSIIKQSHKLEEKEETT